MYFKKRSLSNGVLKSRGYKNLEKLLYIYVIRSHIKAYIKYNFIISIKTEIRRTVNHNGKNE